MNARIAWAVGILAWLATPAAAHRLDEYLQATTISLERNDVRLDMRLIPGIAVFKQVVSAIDLNGDGVVSDSERREYAERVLDDLFLSINGSRIRPRLVDYRFPSLGEMKKGLGEIDLTYSSELPNGSGKRELIFNNVHQHRIAAYLVNCLVPEDPALSINGQSRSFNQSHYRLEYTQTSPPSLWARLIFLAGATAGISGLVMSRRRYRLDEAKGSSRNSLKSNG